MNSRPSNWTWLERLVRDDKCSSLFGLSDEEKSYVSLTPADVLVDVTPPGSRVRLGQGAEPDAALVLVVVASHRYPEKVST